MIDLVIYFLHDSLLSVSDLVTKTAIAYFDKLANYYMIVFVTYLALSITISLLFGLVFFKKLKMQVMTSANILAILPIDDLDHRDKQKID